MRLAEDVDGRGVEPADEFRQLPAVVPRRTEPRRGPGAATVRSQPYRAAYAAARSACDRTICASPGMDSAMFVYRGLGNPRVEPAPAPPGIRLLALPAGAQQKCGDLPTCDRVDPRVATNSARCPILEAFLGRTRCALVVAGGQASATTTFWLAACEHARTSGFCVLSAGGGRRSGVGLCRTGGPAGPASNPDAWAILARSQRLALDRLTLRSTDDGSVADQRGRGGIPRGDRGTRPAPEGDTGRRRSAVAGSFRRVGRSALRLGGSPDR